MSYSIQKIPSEVLAETSAKLKTLRKQVGYSQSELAVRSGVSLGSLKRFERTGQISYISLLKLAHVLNRLDGFDHILLPQKDMSHLEKLFSTHG